MKINIEHLKKFNSLVVEFANKPFNFYLELYENEDSFVDEFNINDNKLIFRVSVLELEKDDKGKEYLHIYLSLFDDLNNFQSARYKAGFFFYKEHGIDEIFMNIFK